MMSRVTPSRLTAALLGLLLVAASPLAAEVDSVFRDFKPSGEFLLETDGSLDKDAQFYLSQRAGAYLVMSPALSSPLLVNMRAGSVEKVSLLKVQKTDRGTIDLLADASFDQVDKFKLERGQEIHFGYKGQAMVVKPKPPLLGQQSTEMLREAKPEYGLAADEYTPEAAAVQALASQPKDNITVRVFLGTWCPVCGRLVPKMIKLDESLNSDKISFEYFGLQRMLNDDPLATQYGVHGVPTAVVFADGKEIGRLDGRQLNQPETALQELLGS